MKKSINTTNVKKSRKNAPVSFNMHEYVFANIDHMPCDDKNTSPIAYNEIIKLIPHDYNFYHAPIFAHAIVNAKSYSIESDYIDAVKIAYNSKNSCNITLYLFVPIALKRDIILFDTTTNKNITTSIVPFIAMQSIVIDSAKNTCSKKISLYTMQSLFNDLKNDTKQFELFLQKMSIATMYFYNKFNLFNIFNEKHTPLK